MAFRADEAAFNGRERVFNHFIPREITGDERARSEIKLDEIIEQYGPVVEGYPAWHPFIAHQDSRESETTPSRRCGYQGLDHTRFFANGFITCPYGDGQEVIDSIEALPRNPMTDVADIVVERLDVTLYQPNASPILVTCNWHKNLSLDGTIPKSLAIPLLLEHELPMWRWAQLAETWESMRPYFLGQPHGSRSSLFVSQETGQAMKTIWNQLIQTGMFGPIKV